MRQGEKDRKRETGIERQGERDRQREPARETGGEETERGKRKEIPRVFKFLLSELHAGVPS